MQLHFKLGFDDYLKIVNTRYTQLFKKGLVPIVIISAIFSFWLSGKNEIWVTYLFGFLIFPVALTIIFYFICLIVILFKKTFSNERIINITNEGIDLLINKAPGFETYFWRNVISIDLENEIYYLSIANIYPVTIPKRCFNSEEIVELERYIETYLESVSEWQWRDIIKIKDNGTSYWMGLLCLIPLIGAFIGLAFVVNGVFKYKNTYLVLIGIAGIIFTVTLYSSLFFWSNSESGRASFIPFTKRDLNILMKEVEFYKLEHGLYPDSLSQVQTKEEFAHFFDPIQKGGAGKYFYEKVNDKYYLFSLGLDGIKNTQDDIYPTITNADDSTKFGLVIRK